MKRSTSLPIASSSATSAVDYAKFRSRSHDAVIRVYDAAGNTDFESARSEMLKLENQLKKAESGAWERFNEALASSGKRSRRC